MGAPRSAPRKICYEDPEMVKQIVSRCPENKAVMKSNVQISDIVGTIWHEIENYKVIHPLKGDQELCQRGLGYVAP